MTKSTQEINKQTSTIKIFSRIFKIEIKKPTRQQLQRMSTPGRISSQAKGEKIRRSVQENNAIPQ